MTDGTFWERLEGETETAYHAFCTYRDMGITRSLRKAAAAFYAEHADPQEATDEPPESGTDSQLTRLKRWSRAWMWVARCEAFDAEEARARSLRLKERRHQLAEQHWRVAALAMNKVAERLAAMGIDEPVPKSLAALMNAAADLGRRSVGEPSASVDLRGAAAKRAEENRDHVWLEGKSVEDLEELARLAGYLSDEDDLPTGPAL